MSQIWHTSTNTATGFILNVVARKSDEMLEPYERKRSRTVLRRERGSNSSDLVDFKYENIQYAMTATEVALFDVTVGRELSNWMGTLTHQNQPLSMFLERPDLGIDPWEMSTTGRQSNINILNYLGVGIVSFTPEEPMEPPPDIGDYVYRTDTDVITAAYVLNTGAHDITPDDKSYISFEILDTTYSTQYVCPTKSGQLVWVKWHTPSTPQTIEITVSDGTTIAAVIEAVPDLEPPDPDFHDVKPSGFTPAEVPSWGEVTEVTWSEWIPEWHPPTYVGLILIPGYWSFEKGDYLANLTVSCNLTPDSRVKTEVLMGADQYEMKSGYGVNAVCSVNVVGGDGVANADVTPVQNVLALFPEFGYQQYNRLLQTAHADYYRGDWEFKPNRYSYYSNPTHFTPLWYPDQTDYEVPLVIFDAWTPAGMLYASVSDSVQIDGSAFDDWYIRILED